MARDWGFTWKSIIVENCYVAIQCVDFGGADGQGVGSISVIGRFQNSLLLRY